MNSTEKKGTPIFCQQVTKEEMDATSRKKTADEMLLLGAEIQSRIEKSKKGNDTKNLVVMEHQLSLSNMLNEYFDLDEVHQKAKMLELFTRLTKLEDTNNQLSSSLDSLNEKYIDEKERADEMDEQCNSYIEDLEEKETECTKKSNQLVKYKGQITKEIKNLEYSVVTLNNQLKKYTSETQWYIYKLWLYIFIIGVIFIIHLNSIYQIV